MTIAWVFPGQGSQWVGMGRDLYAQIPEARAVFDETDAVLDLSIARLCFEGPERDLTATEYAQPALLTVSVALLRSIEAMLPKGVNIRPHFVAGHSLGEYSALVAAGSMDLPTAVRLVRRRGELMAKAREGTMAAIIGLDEQFLHRLCQEVTARLDETVVIANYNAPGQLVISGTVFAVEQTCSLAREAGARRIIPLNVSGAFHSPLMSEATEGMREALAAAQIDDAMVPVVANVTATPLRRAADIREELVTQVMSPVRWSASVQRMVDEGVSTFVEIGAGNVLTGLIKRIAPRANLVNVRTVEEVQAFAATFGRAASVGSSDERTIDG